MFVCWILAFGLDTLQTAKSCLIFPLEPVIRITELFRAAPAFRSINSRDNSIFLFLFFLFNFLFIIIFLYRSLNLFLILLLLFFFFFFCFCNSVNFNDFNRIVYKFLTFLFLSHATQHIIFK